MYGLKDITDVTKLVSIHFMGEFELEMTPNEIDNN